MLDYQTRFPGNLVDQDELRDLVNRLANFAGVKVTSDVVTIVSTDDAEFSSVLDTLADGIGRKKDLKKPEDKIRKKRKGSKEQTWRSASRSWTNEKTKEVLSARELKRRQAAGELEDGITFINWKDVRLVVMDGKLIKEPQA